MLCVGNEEIPSITTLNLTAITFVCRVYDDKIALRVELGFKTLYSRILLNIWSRLKTSATRGHATDRREEPVKQCILCAMTTFCTLAPIVISLPTVNV